MKKLFLILSVILFIISCEKDDNSNLIENVDFQTKDVNVTITLPENSNIDVSNLTVSSLFTFGNDATNGQSSVELFDENAIEMVYATNSEGNIIMLNLINPSSTDEVILNSTTTAQSLAMLHPWVMSLSVEARLEAYEEIALMPEFEDYHNLIIQGISSGELDPLANNSITQAISSFQNTIFSRVEIEKLPLLMVAENDNVKVTNKKSSMAYSLQLYDENNQTIGDEYLVDGVNKEILSWSTVSNVLTGNFDLFQPQEVDFPIPSTNQEYTLKADAWTSNARWRNGAKITSSIVGIVSTTLGKLIENAECGLTIGTFFWNNTNLVIQQLTNNELTTSQAMSSLISFIGNESNELFSLINACPGNYSIGSQAFNQTIKALSIIGNLENGALLFFNAVDIATYDSEIEFCFNKNGNEIQECESVNFSVDINNENWQPTEVTLFDYTQDNQGIYLIAEDDNYKFRGWIYNYNGIGTYSFPSTNVNNTENYFRLTNKTTDITYTTFCANSSVFEIIAIDNLLISASFDLKVCEINNESNFLNLTNGIINLELTNP